LRSAFCHVRSEAEAYRFDGLLTPR
jgi:hypothetical protein